jgi:multidrug resistance efflux pump
MHAMTTALIVGLALIAQPKAGHDLPPLALHRNMEIEDLDRELQRLHDAVLVKRSQLASTQRLAQRNLASQSDLAAETADCRLNEAREAETLSYRALRAYERDVMGGVIPADDDKAYELLLDWLRKQEAIAQADLDFRDYTLRQTRALFQKKVVSRQEFEEAGINFLMAEAAVALSRSRQAQVLMDMASKRDGRPFDEAEYNRLKTEYLKARVRYHEVVAEGARTRLDIAQERSRRGLIPANEMAIFRKADDEAEANLASERKRLDESQAPPPGPAPGSS